MAARGGDAEEKRRRSCFFSSASPPCPGWQHEEEKLKPTIKMKPTYNQNEAHIQSK